MKRITLVLGLLLLVGLLTGCAKSEPGMLKDRSPEITASVKSFLPPNTQLKLWTHERPESGDDGATWSQNYVLSYKVEATFPGEKIPKITTDFETTNKLVLDSYYGYEGYPEQETKRLQDNFYPLPTDMETYTALDSYIRQELKFLKKNPSPWQSPSSDDELIQMGIQTQPIYLMKFSTWLERESIYAPQDMGVKTFRDVPFEKLYVLTLRTSPFLKYLVSYDNNKFARVLAEFELPVDEYGNRIEFDRYIIDELESPKKSSSTTP